MERDRPPGLSRLTVDPGRGGGWGGCPGDTPVPSPVLRTGVAPRPVASPDRVKNRGSRRLKRGGSSGEKTASRLVLLSCQRSCQARNRGRPQDRVVPQHWAGSGRHTPSPPGAQSSFLWRKASSAQGPKYFPWHRGPGAAGGGAQASCRISRDPPVGGLGQAGWLQAGKGAVFLSFLHQEASPTAVRNHDVLCGKSRILELL